MKQYHKLQTTTSKRFSVRKQSQLWWRCCCSLSIFERGCASCPSRLFQILSGGN